MAYQSPKPFPFIPPGHTIGYVAADHDHIVAARNAAQASKGCRWRVGTVLVKDDQIIGQGANATDAPQDRTLFCPRQVLECPSGQGYEHCPACVGIHSEVAAVKNAKANGNHTDGTDAYLYGHWWCCEPCWKVMIDAGVRNVYLVEQATEQFEKVDWQPPAWSQPIQTYVSGSLTHSAMERRALYEQVGRALELANLGPYVPHQTTEPNMGPDGENHKPRTPEEIWRINHDVIKDSQLMVAFVDEPSLGVGMELQIAEQYEIPVIVLAHIDARVSRMALGFPQLQHTIRYHELPDLLTQLHSALDEVVVPRFGI